MVVPSVLWRCWLGGRKGIRPVKTEWWGAGVVICLDLDADLPMAQLLPLPLTVSCFSKIQIGFTFLVLAHAGGPGQRAVKRVCVCVCACVCACVLVCIHTSIRSMQRDIEKLSAIQSTDDVVPVYRNSSSDRKVSQTTPGNDTCTLHHNSSQHWLKKLNQTLLLLLNTSNVLFSMTTWVSRYQKGKTSLDLNEASDDGTLECSGISWTIHKQPAPCSRQITTSTPHHLIFTGLMLFMTPNQQCQSTEGKLNHTLLT